MEESTSIVKIETDNLIDLIKDKYLLIRTLRLALELIIKHQIDAPNTIGKIEAVLEKTQPAVD